MLVRSCVCYCIFKHHLLGSSLRYLLPPSFVETAMPEHNLEPPRFARRSLERILNDWLAVRAMILTGSAARADESRAPAADVMFEDDVYLNSQHGTQRLDKFVHTLLVKCSAAVRSPICL